MKNLAQIISFVFNPLFFILLMPYFIVYRETASNFYAFKWGLFSAVFIFFGLLILVFGKQKGYFSDFDLSKREERAKFYMFLWPLLLLYVFAAIFFKGIFFGLSIVAFGVVFGLILFELINTKIKASLHVGVACAFILAMSALYGISLFFLTLWIPPVIAWSRLVLKRHTMPEIIAGGFLGTAVSLLTFIVTKILINSQPL